MKTPWRYGAMAAIALASALLALTGLLASATSAPAHRRPAARAVSADARVLKVVGLGDSVPAGAACHCTPFVEQLADELQQATRSEPRIVTDNEGSGGQTSRGLLAQVHREGRTADADAVTLVTIGANDFDPALLQRIQCQGARTLGCYRAALVAMGRNVRSTLALLRPGPKASGPVLVTGYWNVFLDGAAALAQGRAYVRDSDTLTRAVNDELRGAAASAGASYVDLYAAFKAAGDDTALLAADGDHPSASGHALITRALKQSLGPLLRSP